MQAMKPAVSPTEGVDALCNGSGPPRDPTETFGLATIVIRHESELYDVNAKAGKSAVDEMQTLGKDQRDVENQRMLQALLKDRFKMTLNRGTKDLPIYSLVVAEVGKLHEAQGDCDPEPPWTPGMPPPPPPCGGLRVFN